LSFLAIDLGCSPQLRRDIPPDAIDRPFRLRISAKRIRFRRAPISLRLEFDFPANQLS
jgi:hypothetical protein